MKSVNHVNCFRCEGRGKIPSYEAFNGLCLKCMGSGKQPSPKGGFSAVYAVFFMNTETGKPERVGDFAARSSAEALREAKEKYFRASDMFRDIYTTHGAVAINREELK